MAPNTAGHRAFGNLRLLSLSLLLGVCIYAVIKTALDGVWVISALFAVFSLLALVMIWATQRQASHGPRDKLAVLLLLGVVVFVVLILAAASLA